MWTVVAALLPAAAVGVFYFGIPALVVLVTATAGCVAFEALFQRLMGREVTVSDGSAALTGLLLGMNLPPASPAWMVVVGCAVAIFLGKLVFGGLGFNPFNPALVARVFLLISFPVQMTTWSPPTGLFAAAPGRRHRGHAARRGQDGAADEGDGARGRGREPARRPRGAHPRAASARPR